MQGASVVEGNQGHKLICRSEDQLRLVQLSGRLLAVNQLRPYMGWEEGFRDTILARWHEVKEMLRVGKVARIGLRYINRIEILQNPLKWEDWFHFSLPLPASMQQAEGKFHMVFQQPLDGGLNCTVNIAKDQAAPQGATWVILDFNVILEASIPADDLPHHLERIHGPHSLAFEAYVRDSLRQQFEPLPAS